MLSIFNPASSNFQLSAKIRFNFSTLKSFLFSIRMILARFVNPSFPAKKWRETKMLQGAIWLFCRLNLPSLSLPAIPTTFNRTGSAVELSSAKGAFMGITLVLSIRRIKLSPVLISNFSARFWLMMACPGLRFGNLIFDRLIKSSSIPSTSILFALLPVDGLLAIPWVCRIAEVLQFSFCERSFAKSLLTNLSPVSRANPTFPNRRSTILRRLYSTESPVINAPVKMAVLSKVPANRARCCRR